MRLYKIGDRVLLPFDTRNKGTVTKDQTDENSSILIKRDGNEYPSSWATDNIKLIEANQAK